MWVRFVLCIAICVCGLARVLLPFATGPVALTFMGMVLYIVPVSWLPLLCSVGAALFAHGVIGGRHRVLQVISMPSVTYLVVSNLQKVAFLPADLGLPNVTQEQKAWFLFWSSRVTQYFSMHNLLPGMIVIVGMVVLLYLAGLLKITRIHRRRNVPGSIRVTLQSKD